jgi:CRP/FNR family transcriptional regulator, cyclic AMP receptor protein
MSLKPKRENSTPQLAQLVAYASNGVPATAIATGQSVFRQGAPADSAFYLHAGLVKISVLSKSGREAVLLVVGPGNLFGESCLTRDAKRAASAIAMTDSLVQRIAASTLHRAIAEEPAFARLLIDRLLIRSRRLQEDLADHHFRSTEKRLARTLLRLARIDRGDGIGSELPHLGQTELAEMIGTTRSRVNFFMNKFRRLGFIHYDGKLIVNRSLAQIVENE